MTTPAIIWLVFGGLLLAVNKVVEKYNLVYAASAAFTIGLFVIMGIMGGDGSEPYIIAQIIFFFMATLLWWYLFREKNDNLTDKEKDFYKEIVGKIVEVGENGINSISGGEVKFQGKVLTAKLADNVDDETIEFIHFIWISIILLGSYLVNKKEKFR